MEHAIEQNGIGIVRTPTGIGVMCIGNRIKSVHKPLKVEVDYLGRRIKSELISRKQPWRDYYDGLDMLRCVIRVLDGQRVLAELGPSSTDIEILPFMVVQGQQVHITENYVSVPPALTITDSVGAVWTLGFKTAPKELSPDGEYAFNVLRDGIDTQEIASRIERRNGKIRIFTRHGWKNWTGTSFF